MENILYSKQVIEFVTVSNEYCKFLEGIEDFTAKKFISTSGKLLPFLYMKASLLPEVETISETPLEKVFTQADWTTMQGRISSKLKEDDLFFLMKNPQSFADDEEIELTVSEVFTDIYQDLYDLTSLFRIGNEDIMNDSLAECKSSFEQYWGKRLLALLNQLHYIIYEPKIEKDNPDNPLKDDKMEWFLDD